MEDQRTYLATIPSNWVDTLPELGEYISPYYPVTTDPEFLKDGRNLQDMTEDVTNQLWLKTQPLSTIVAWRAHNGLPPRFPEALPVPKVQAGLNATEESEGSGESTVETEATSPAASGETAERETEQSGEQEEDEETGASAESETQEETAETDETEETEEKVEAEGESEAEPERGSFDERETEEESSGAQGSETEYTEAGVRT